MAKGDSEAADKVADNVDAVVAVRAKASGRLSRHHLLIERITDRLARPRTTYAVAAFLTVWVTGNFFAHAKAFDPPPFFWLQGIVGVLALLVTTMILTTQRMQGRRAEQQAHLDLQVNLLAEQKIAKLIALVEELRRDMPTVHNRHDPMARAMEEAIDPQRVVSVLEERLRDEADDELSDRGDD